jgi:hypothetical protein
MFAQHIRVSFLEISITLFWLCGFWLFLFCSCPGFALQLFWQKAFKAKLIAY